MTDGNGQDPSEEPEMPVMMTTTEAAQMLRVSRETLLNRVRDGSLKAHRTHPGRGGRYLFKQQDVLDFIRSLEQEPAQPSRD